MGSSTVVHHETTTHDEPIIRHCHRHEMVTDDEKNGRISMKTIVIVLAIDFIYLAQLVILVGAGAYARDIAAVVGGSTQTVWLSQVLVIGTTSLSPVVAQAADYWGRKWFLVPLTALGVPGAIIVSRANTIGMVIAGLSITGLSFAAQPLLHAVVSEVLPRKQRPWAQASINISASMGGILGLLVGGALTRHGRSEGFRAYFYMVAAINAAASITCALLYNPPTRELQTSLSTEEKLHRLDWIGYPLLSIGLILFSIALSWSQNPYPWTDAHVLATFLVGSVLLLVFASYEKLGRKDGMFHHGLFLNRNYTLALMCIFIEGLVFLAANNYYAFEVSVLSTQDPIVGGLHYCVMFLLLGLSAMGAGTYCSRFKSVRWPAVFSLTCLMVFNVLMATIKVDSPRAVLWGYPVILGLGLGSCLIALLVVAQLSTPPELIAIASGLMVAVRSFGGTIGLAVYNAIFNHTFSANLASKIATATLPLGLPTASLGPLIDAVLTQDNAALAEISGVTPEIIGAAVGGLTETYVLAFRYVWVAAACFTSVGVILSFFIFDPKKDFNAHIDAPVENIVVVHHEEISDQKAES
ncbi:uncharacterized protein A1O9_02185 [Exophiala aquamarina CBS 119918]|uniref:Major facilitator superfamily (MFS) profile domain-containing protein n=1 Tax=Exophiala aquamarina CBS 119918 TaxID=1182545 RepID=A0A072PKI4_9EURO|nr:uncharacterized protein A1O9_02185 [Exophiala aquamarina CBS 119918]KEF60624.1 hypothetical protein A1O9_02185 [Exophiala aquamarina CBS 119918]